MPVPLPPLMFRSPPDAVPPSPALKVPLFAPPPPVTVVVEYTKLLAPPAALPPPPAPIVIVAEPVLNVTNLIAVPPAAPLAPPLPLLPLEAPPAPPPVTVTLHLVTPAGTDHVPEEVNTARLEKPPLAGALDVHVVPLDVNILPDVPGATAAK